MPLACVKPFSVQSYLDQVVSVSWDTALALQATGTRFLLLLSGDDQISRQMRALLQTALQHHRVKLLVVDVQVSKESIAAQKFAVSMVPQVRVYGGGVELNRQRGTMDYLSLVKMLNVAAGRAS